MSTLRSAGNPPEPAMQSVGDAPASPRAVPRVARVARLAVAVAVALLVAGCGGGPQDDGTQRQGANQGQGRRVIEMDSGEFFFAPDRIEVEQGVPVTLVLKNSGSVEHNITIEEFGVDRTYGPGQTIEVTFTPFQAGTFEIACLIAGHSESGMVGTLVVRESSG